MLTLLNPGATTLAAPGTFDVTGLAQTYTDLVIKVFARGSYNGGALENLLLRFNGDSTAGIYQWTNISGTGAAAASGGSTGSASIICANISTSASDANYFSTAEIIIPNYAVASGASVPFSKTSMTLSNTYESSAGSGPTHYVWSGMWRSTAAITRVTIFGNNAANLVTGSICEIYGRT